MDASGSPIVNVFSDDTLFPDNFTIRNGIDIFHDLLDDPYTDSSYGLLMYKSSWLTMENTILREYTDMETNGLII